MTSSFYAWLVAQPVKHAFLLRAYDALRIPKTANKLHVLLRFTDTHPLAPTRRLLKDAHREWRQHQRNPPYTSLLLLDRSNRIPEQQYQEIAELKDVQVNFQSNSGNPDEDYFVELPGLKPSGELVFTLNFQPTEEQDKAWDALWREVLDYQRQRALGIPLPKPNRWNRVYRRWGFKHRENCIQCNVTPQNGIVFPIKNCINVCTACYGYAFVMETFINRDEQE